MTNHPTGDTALSRAITTGAPVATNDKQAAELTQKWGVWCKPKDGSEQRWAELVDVGGVRHHRVFEDRAAAEYCRLGWEGHDGDECNYEVRPYPSPTPRPTPGGELALTNNGIEWTWAYSSLYSKYVITNGARFIDVCFEPQAKALCARLNAADAMEKALKAIADGSVEYSSTHDNAAQDMRDYAAAALRGGA